MTAYQYIFKDQIDYDVYTVQASTLLEAQHLAFIKYVDYYSPDLNNAIYKELLPFHKFVKELEDGGSVYMDTQNGTVLIFPNHFDIQTGEVIK